MSRQRSTPPAPSGRPRRRSLWIGAALVLILAGSAGAVVMRRALSRPVETLRGLYVGSASCGECHTANYPAWKQTLHASMVQLATPDTVEGDFLVDNEYRLRDGTWSGPAPENDRVLVRMVRNADEFYSYIFDPATARMNPYRITHVVGTSFRQTYLVESKGVFFRVPIQWDVKNRRWVNLWNRQAKQDESIDTPMEYLLNSNAHWNEACARCHTTGYRLDHGGQWNELGIACEACHGPGGAHMAYYQGNRRLRLRSEILRWLGNEPESYIVRPSRLDPAGSVSVCAQCHHADVWQRSIDAMVGFEPGGDLSPHFRETPLERDAALPPSNKTWPDGSGRGAGMLFRTFVESRCFSEGGARCIDCHSPHLAGEYRDRLQAGRESDRYCIDCHPSIGDDVERHTRHRADQAGSRCYGCHMPRMLEGLTMVGDFDYARVRTHELDHIPFPEASIQFGGPDRMPHACHDCHADRSPDWAADWARRWWGPRERIAAEIADRPPSSASRNATERSLGL